MSYEEHHSSYVEEVIKHNKELEAVMLVDISLTNSIGGLDFYVGADILKSEYEDVYITIKKVIKNIIITEVTNNKTLTATLDGLPTLITNEINEIYSKLYINAHLEVSDIYLGDLRLCVVTYHNVLRHIYSKYNITNLHKINVLSINHAVEDKISYITIGEVRYGEDRD